MTATQHDIGTIVPLLPYQEEFIRDPARARIVLKSRQTGFTKFVFSLIPVLEGLEGGPDWILLSAGERQSAEIITSVQRHCRAVNAAAEFYEDEFRFDDGSFKQLTVRLPSGVRIIGLPANPATARGYSGNTILDEFAFHRDGHKIWAALSPSITWGFKIVVGSTLFGISNKYYELWSRKNEDFWSKHHVDIYEAVAQGLPADIEELKGIVDDPDAWAEEFECIPRDDASTLLTHTLISSCEDPRLGLDLALDDLVGDLYLGNDVGRKHDRTVFWLWEKLGGIFWTRGILTLKGMRFAEQREILYGLLAHPRLRRACLDATGIGAQLAEEAQEKFGSKVEQIVFTPAVKEDLAITMLRQFEDRTARVPVDSEIRRSLNSVKKVTTVSGNVRFDAARDKHGHADHFWAGALGLHAGLTSDEVGPVEYESLQQRRSFDGFTGESASVGRMSMRPPGLPAAGGFGRGGGAW